MNSSEPASARTTSVSAVISMRGLRAPVLVEQIRVEAVCHRPIT